MTSHAHDFLPAAHAHVVREGMRWAIACCGVTLAVGMVAEQLGGLRPAAVSAVVLAQALFLSVALARLDGPRAPLRLGACNRITMMRTSFVALFAAFAILPPESASIHWVLVAGAIVALVLDGLDGAAARRGRNASRYGAWLDQEVDALFVVALSALVWRLGEAGPWILAAGAWRYAFLAARAVSPRLRGELSPSQRRKVVCVVQLGALVACIAPIIEPPLSTALAATSLVVLTWSFGVDLVQLWRTHPPTPVGSTPLRAR